MDFDFLEEIKYTLHIAKYDLEIIDSIIISKKIATLYDILQDKYDNCIDDNSYKHKIKKLFSKCIKLWNSKYKEIYENNNIDEYSPKYKDEDNDIDNTYWNDYLQDQPNNDDDKLHIKVKIIILNDFIECFDDYQNNLTLKEVIAIRDKYIEKLSDIQKM